MYIEIKLWSCTNFTLQGNSLFLKNIYIFKYLVLCNRDYMNTENCKIGRFIYWIFLFVLFCANSKSLFLRYYLPLFALYYCCCFFLVFWEGWVTLLLGTGRKDLTLETPNSVFDLLLLLSTIRLLLRGRIPS